MRLLIGPLSPSSTLNSLASVREAGHCRFFGLGAGIDVDLSRDATWISVAEQLRDWIPDGVLLLLPYSVVPPAVWEWPVPKFAWAAEPDLQWQAYRQILPFCEVVLAEPAQAQCIRDQGIAAVAALPLARLDDLFLTTLEGPSERPIDVLVVGNLSPAVQRRRLPWLNRLAAMGERWNVRVESGVPLEGYRHLLSQSKIVLELTRPHHFSRRILEAASSGAVPMVPKQLAALYPEWEDSGAWITYEHDDLELTCDAILADPDRLAKCASRARELAANYTWQARWSDLEQALGIALQDQTHRHPRAAPLAAAWQELYSREPTQTFSLVALESASDQDATEAVRLNLRAALVFRQSGNAASPVVRQKVVELLRQAVLKAPSSSILHLNLAEALVYLGDTPAAAQQARHALRVACTQSVARWESVEVVHFPPLFDSFRIAWDEAIWLHGAQDSRLAREHRTLVSWRLHSLLADLTGDSVHAFSAALARPDAPSTQLALGMFLANHAHPTAALAPLRAGLASSPLERTPARVLWDCLGAVEDEKGQRELATARAQLHRVCPRLVPVDDWFRSLQPTPSRDQVPRASIIIPCCGQSALTDMCLAALTRHTSMPYEVIVVDNGSTDETSVVLRTWSERLGPSVLKVLRLEKNIGFARACNIGAQSAKAPVVVLLNNDTLPTAEWLDGLLDVLHSNDRVGLCGPMSNHATPPQLVQARYDAQTQLDEFAAQHRSRHRGDIIVPSKLSGFCLAIRKEVWDELGGFDERFFAGFFEDDDICRRAKEAGWELRVAADVFVHHEGSATFLGLGLPREELLAAGLEKYSAKWGADASASLVHVKLPREAHCTPHAIVRSCRVALNMIVRNEAHNLPQCLRTSAELFDEIVIADTGSNDGTRAAASSFNIKWVDFPWIDHFAAARNAALGATSSQWVMWLDADDRLDQDARAALSHLFARLDDRPRAIAMKIRSSMDPQQRHIRILDQVRLFPRHPEVRWEYRIHEQILPGVRRLGGGIEWASIYVDHVGYQDPALRSKKLERNLRLLRLEDAEHPSDSFTLFNLGWTLLDSHEPREALMRLERSLALAAPDSSILRKLYVLIAQALKHLGQSDRALLACRQGRCRFPDDLELPFEMALLLRERRDWQGMEACLSQLLNIEPGQYFTSVDPELKDVRARLLLAEACRHQGKWGDVETHCRKGLAKAPHHGPLWLELAECCLARGDAPGLEEAAQGLATQAGLALDADIVRARGHQARGNFTEARQILEPLLAQIPRALGPHLLLSHILLAEGRDPDAAEAVLRHILKLEPQHAEAHHNLRVLLSRKAQTLHQSAIL